MATVREFEVDGRVTLYRGSDRVLVLNATASDVWRLCDGTSSRAEVVATIARAYGMDPGEIAAAVLAAIDQLLQEGFLCASSTEDES